VLSLKDGSVYSVSKVRGRREEKTKGSIKKLKKKKKT
jgi:hypothetical protein